MKRNPYETKVVYGVWSNTDLTEGKGVSFIQYYCDLEATARRLAACNYVQGSNSPVSAVELLALNDRWYFPSHITISPTEMDILKEKELSKEREEVEKKKAILDKARRLGLSDEEIAVLSS